MYPCLVAMRMMIKRFLLTLTLRFRPLACLVTMVVMTYLPPSTDSVKPSAVRRQWPLFPILRLKASREATLSRVPLRDHLMPPFTLMNLGNVVSRAFPMNLCPQVRPGRKRLLAMTTEPRFMGHPRLLSLSSLAALSLRVNLKTNRMASRKVFHRATRLIVLVANRNLIGHHLEVTVERPLKVRRKVYVSVLVAMRPLVGPVEGGQSIR